MENYGKSECAPSSRPARVANAALALLGLTRGPGLIFRCDSPLEQPGSPSPKDLPTLTQHVVSILNHVHEVCKGSSCYITDSRCLHHYIQARYAVTTQE